MFIGGAPPHAFRRALAHGAGWMPVGVSPDVLAPLVTELNAQASAKGIAAPPIAVLTSLPLADTDKARDVLARYAAAGATRVIHGERYADERAFRTMLERLVRTSA